MDDPGDAVMLHARNLGKSLAASAHICVSNLAANMGVIYAEVPTSLLICSLCLSNHCSSYKALCTTNLSAIKPFAVGAAPMLNSVAIPTCWDLVLAAGHRWWCLGLLLLSQVHQFTIVQQWQDQPW
jgi:hypothetical protein